MKQLLKLFLYTLYGILCGVLIALVASGKPQSNYDFGPALTALFCIVSCGAIGLGIGIGKFVCKQQQN